jgi:hypothetical protein
MSRHDPSAISGASVPLCWSVVTLPARVWAWSVAQVLGAERHAAQRGCQHAHTARRSRGSLACIDCGATFVETGL